MGGVAIRAEGRVWACREAGDPAKAKLHLPNKQKQYLITRNGARARPLHHQPPRPQAPVHTNHVNITTWTHAVPTLCAVPCYQRAAAVTGAAAGHEELLEGDAGEQWVAADGPDGGATRRAAAAAGADDDIPTLGEDEPQKV